jgi:hypothetical protein
MDDQKEIIERAGDSSILKEGMDVSASNRPFHSKPGIIYKVTNLINGKIYIGKTVAKLKKRISSHIFNVRSSNYNSAFHAAIRKYGEQNFKWEVIDKCLFPDILCELEKFYIKQFNCKAPGGYNLTDGGDGACGHTVTPEVRKKISDALCGEKNFNYGKKFPEKSVETKRKISIANTGKHRSEETKMRMSAAQKGRIVSAETRKKISNSLSGEKHHMFGKHHSLEARKKISIAGTNRHPSPESREKIRLSRIGMRKVIVDGKSTWRK